MERANVANGVRRTRKKPAKDELDRIKQAEKKKKRLEKALANSAAIRSELEKKKQKKIEEQQRLDEEGAAIAEAVALNVLAGEDSDDNILDEGSNNFCDSIGNIQFVGQMGFPYFYRKFPEHEIGANRWVPNVYGDASEWGNSHRNIYVPCSDEVSVDLIVAQAVASLQIAEDVRFESRMFDSMLRG